MVKGVWQKIFTMYGASALAIALGFLVSIFNSRILGPEDFGNYKFIETVARFIASIVSVGLFISITRLLALNENKLKERKYIGLFTVIFAITSCIGILLFLGFSYIEPYFFKNGLDATMRVYFFIVLAIVGNLALAQILKGLHKIYTIALFSILPVSCYLILIYGINEMTPVNLETVLLTYYGVLLFFIVIILLGLKPDFKFKKGLVKELFVENKFNGKPIYFGSLAGVATTHIAGLSISFFLDNVQVGFFMLALTICSPMLVIPSVLGTIYFKQFASIEVIPKKVFYFTILSTILALAIFYGLIEKVIITFYTEAYLPVSDISKFLIIAFIFHGLGDLYNRFLGAKGKGKLLRNGAYMVGIVNVLGYIVFIKYFGVKGAILTRILASGLYLIVMWYYYSSFVKTNTALNT